MAKFRYPNVSHDSFSVSSTVSDEKLLSFLLYMLQATFRILPLFMATSLLPLMRLPMQIKLILIIVTALLITSQANYALTAYNYSFPLLLISCFMEFLAGLLIIWGVQATVASIQTLGNVLDMQMGLGAAAIVDPKTQQRDTLIGSLLLMVTLLAMLELNFHHDLLKVLIASFTTIPVGREFSGINLTGVVEGLSLQFFLGLIMALPVLLSLLVLDIVIGFIAKTMPQANIYFVVLPLKILVGIIVLAITSPFLAANLAEAFAQAKVTMFNLVMGG